MIAFTIYGNPVAQGRPKFYRRGDFVGVYDPKKSRDWKSEVKAQALEHKPDKLLQGAVKMSLVFKLQRPKSLPKKVRHHIKKPDLDNLVKGVKDALAGICYERDQQITSLDVRKEYAEDGFAPCVMVSIEIEGVD